MTERDRLVLAVIVLDVPVRVSVVLAGVAEALTENVSGSGPPCGGGSPGGGPPCTVMTSEAAETVTPAGSPLT
jgi:hypothetical protein